MMAPARGVLAVGGAGAVAGGQIQLGVDGTDLSDYNYNSEYALPW